MSHLFFHFLHIIHSYALRVRPGDALHIRLLVVSASLLRGQIIQLFHENLLSFSIALGEISVLGILLLESLSVLVKLS